MALKTFNIDKEVYEEFSKHCKENGISMSKKVENFIKDELGKLGRKAGFIEKMKTLNGENREKEPSFAKYC
jgi:hypothetical protein